MDERHERRRESGLVSCGPPGRPMLSLSACAFLPASQCGVAGKKPLAVVLGNNDHIDHPELNCSSAVRKKPLLVHSGCL